MASPRLFIIGGPTPSTSVGPIQTFLELDSTVELNTEFNGSVSSHPVSNGTRITDHFTRENPKFSLRGVTSNTPVRTFNEFHVVKNVGKRTKNAYDVLKGMYETGSLFTIRSDLDVYPNCIIRNFGFTQNAQQAEALYVDLQIEQLRVVGARRITALIPVKDEFAVDSQTTNNKGQGKAKEMSEDNWSSTKRVLSGEG